MNCVTSDEVWGMGRGEGGEAQEDQSFASSYFLRLSSTRDNELILSCPKLTEMIFVLKISQRSKIFSKMTRLLDRKEAHRDRIKADYKEK